MHPETAAADFQPETDAPENTGTGENENPATAEAAESTADGTDAAAAADGSPDEAPADAEPEQTPESTDDAEPAVADAEPAVADAEPAVADAGPAAGAETPAPASDEPWGRVDEDGTVSVREAAGWRVVGQYPDGSAEEALAYFERKYSDLASEVTLLEVRHRRGGASASDLRATARTINGKLDGAAAVGDLASLAARVAALTETLAAESETEAVAARAAVDDAVKARTELVEKAEALAARDPKTVQWKQASADLNALFEQWQSQQQSGPRLP